jgi:hypothetical protein
MDRVTNGAQIVRIAKIAALGVAWISLSAAVVLLNKFILSATPFKYVISLTLTHMLWASALCKVLFAVAPSFNGVAAKQESVKGEGLRLRFGAIAALFALSLITSNAALQRLDVASVQMIKAVTPASIYALGVFWGVERPRWSMVATLALICGGVVYAVRGVLTFQPAGFVLQISSILLDSARYLYVQTTLQSLGADLNPIQVLDMVAPVATVFLWTSGSIWEFSRISMTPQELRACLPLVVYSAMLAFALNICSYSYIKTTSALTMSVSGIIKDVIMIGISVKQTGLALGWDQLAGFAVAVVGTVAYNGARSLRSRK